VTTTDSGIVGKIHDASLNSNNVLKQE